MKIDKNTLQWLVITIFLGAVGSGFWEYILKPIALSSTNIFLGIATLGMVTFKNSLYVEIAQGNLKEPNLAFIQISVSAVLGILLGGLFALLSQSTKEQSKDQIEQLKERMENLKERRQKAKERIEKLKEIIGTEQSIEKEQIEQLKIEEDKGRIETEQLEERIEEFKKSIETEQLNQIEKTRRTILVQGGLLFLFLTIFLVISSSRVSYVNKAITHFNQLLAISSPYLTPDERLEKISLFAQVRNRDDYFKIVTDLSTVCKQNKLKVPEFLVW